MTSPFDLPLLGQSQSPAETPEQAPDELKLLKQRADIMGIKYSNNIGVETLKDKIKEAMEGEKKAPPTQAEASTQESGEDREATDEEVREKLPGKVTPMTKRELFLHQKAEYMKLVRLRIQNMNPAKASLPGEIITVSNSVLGTVSKFVPYGDECGEDGYHVPYILYLAMKERKFAQVKTDKNHRPRASDVHEFALEVLPSLTEKQLRTLALKQAAANGTTEAQSGND